MFSNTETASVIWQRTLIFFGVIFYLLLFQHGIHGDAHVRFEALMLLLREGKFLPNVYSLVGPLVSSPLLLMGHVIKDEHWWLSRFNTFVFFGMLFFFAR